jgi:outer membrane protein
MGMGKSTRTVILGLATVVCGCNTTEPPPFRPKALQAEERARASETPPAELSPMPTTFVSPLDRDYVPTSRPSTYEDRIGLPPASNAPHNLGRLPTTAPTTGTASEIAAPATMSLEAQPTTRPGSIRLSLKEIIQRTVAYNLDVKVASFDPAVEQTRVIEAQGRFDPTFFSNLQYQDSKILTPSQGLQQSDPFEPTVSRVTSGQAGLRQNLPSGGQAELRTGSQYINRNIDPSFNITDPYWLNDVTLQITQPLLRDFGYGVNQARIVIAKNTQRVSLLDLRKAVEDNLELAERTYWQLVQAERELAIADRLYYETNDTVELLRKRFGQDVSRVQVSQAFASAQSRKAALLRARQQVENLSDQLKRVMNDPDLPVSSGTTILPGTDPVEEPISFTLDDQVKTALDNRLELGQQMLRIDSASVATDVAKNNLMPSLNLQATGGLQGIGADMGDSYHSLSNDDQYNTWSLGFQFEIPIGNRVARSIWHRALLQRQQALESYRSLVEQVTLDVKQNMRDVEVSYQEITERRNSRFAAADNLSALQQREDAQEPLTPDFINLKLDAQSRLADAAREEATAISAYNIAIARLEKAKGTILRYNNVQLQQEPRPFGSNPR